MSSFGKWCLWIGLGLIAVALLASAIDLIPVTVIAAILGLIGVGTAAYDAIYEALGRSELRRRAAKVKREREQGR